MLAVSDFLEHFEAKLFAFDVRVFEFVELFKDRQKVLNDAGRNAGKTFAGENRDQRLRRPGLGNEHDERQFIFFAHRSRETGRAQ